MNVNHKFFDGSPKSDWLGGLLAADGSVSQKGDYWTLSQSGEHGYGLVSTTRNLINCDARIVTVPTACQDAHKIHVTSRKMCKDLDLIYDVAPAKTYKYRGPSNHARMTSAFIRGYVDGDGSVGVYSAGNSPRLLTITFVGTKEFIDRVAPHLPEYSSIQEIVRAKNLWELRWYGAKAFDFGNWVYADTSLPSGKKSSIFYSYLDEVVTDPPGWLKSRPLHDEVIRLFLNGDSRAACGIKTGVGHNSYKIIRKYIERENETTRYN